MISVQERPHSHLSALLKASDAPPAESSVSAPMLTSSNGLMEQEGEATESTQVLTKKGGLLKNLHDLKLNPRAGHNPHHNTLPRPTLSTSCSPPSSSGSNLSRLAVPLADPRMLSSSPPGEREEGEGGLKRSSRTKENITKAKNFAKRMLTVKSADHTTATLGNSGQGRERSGSFSRSKPPQLPLSDSLDEETSIAAIEDEIRASGLVDQLDGEEGEDALVTSVNGLPAAEITSKREKVKAFAKKILGGSALGAGSNINGSNTWSGKSKQSSVSPSLSVPSVPSQPLSTSSSSPPSLSAGTPPSATSTTPVLGQSSKPFPGIPLYSTNGASGNGSAPAEMLSNGNEVSTSNPQASSGGLLEVTICKARNLYSTDESLVDAYCEVMLLDYFGNAAKKDERKTKVVRGTLDPVWDETFVFDFDAGECSGLKIVCKDNHRFREDSFLGHVIISTTGFMGAERVDRWYPLCARKKDKRTCITGDILVRISYLSELEAQRRRAMKVYNVKEVPAAKQKIRKKLKKHFGASDDETLYDEFSCALRGKQGRLFVTSQHLYFYSNILGVLTKLRISYEDIKSVEKKKTALLFPNAILITVKKSKFFFYSFIHRDRAYELIRMKKCSYLRKQTDETEPFIEESPEEEEVIQPDILDEGDHDNEFLSITPKSGRSDTVLGSLPNRGWLEDMPTISPIYPRPLDEVKVPPLELAGTKRRSPSASPETKTPPSPRRGENQRPEDSFEWLGTLSPRPTPSSTISDFPLSRSATPPAQPQTLEPPKAEVERALEIPRSPSPRASESPSAPEQPAFIASTSPPKNSAARPTALPRHLQGPLVLDKKLADLGTSDRPTAESGGSKKAKESLGHRGRLGWMILILSLLNGAVLPGVYGDWETVCLFSIVFSVCVSLFHAHLHAAAQQVGLRLVETLKSGTNDLQMEFLGTTVFPAVLQPPVSLFYIVVAWLLIDSLSLSAFAWITCPFIFGILSHLLYQPNDFSAIFSSGSTKRE